MNEPIAHFFDAAILNPFLEPLYKAIVKEVRKVDKNHIVFLGGAQWDTNFNVFGEPFDLKTVYTFHKYWEEPTPGSIERFIAFRAKYNVPIYLGESGENTDEWIERFRKLLEENNIGWHFWPYKKMNSPSNIISIPMPTYFDSVIAYAETPRTSFEEIRKAKPKNKEQIKQALDGFLENCKFEKCQPNTGYINALGLHL